MPGRGRERKGETVGECRGEDSERRGRGTRGRALNGSRVSEGRRGRGMDSESETARLERDPTPAKPKKADSLENWGAATSCKAASLDSTSC